jgi:hypothetical protein
VITAGADVNRGDWIERLPATPDVWGTLPESVPLLDNHHNGSVRDVIGSAGAFRFEGGKMLATLRITDSAVAEQVKRGAPLKLSMGYRHLKRQRTVENGKRIENVTSARLGEVSLVIHPADQAAQFRSDHPLPTEQQTEAQQTRAAIREVARTAGLPATWADEQIDTEATVEVARSAAFEAMAERSRQRQLGIRAAVGFSNEDPAVVTRRMAEALAADAAGVPVTDDGANQYRGLGFRGLARLAVEGMPGARFMSDATMIDAAFTRNGGSHSVTDFPTALLGTGNRIVAHAYGEAASPIESNLVTYGTASDFRPVTEVQLGGLPNLQPLSENGEIQAVSTAEESTSWKLGTYAGRIDVSRKMLVNDDLGLFGRISAELGRVARRTETAAIVALLVSNPTMADGKALFHADHGNLKTPGNVVAADLAEAIRAVQAQRGLGGEIIGLRPAYLLVSPENEFEARKVLATINPATVDDVNPLSGVLEMLVEPRLTGNDWHVFAKPSQAPVLKVAHLAGQRGPVVQQQERWNGLGTSFRVFTDFGTTAVDWRGAYRNNGGS